MDNEATRLLNDEPINNSPKAETPKMETPKAKRSAKKGNTVATAAGGFVVGAAAGATATSAAQQPSHPVVMEEESAKVEDMPVIETHEAPVPEEQVAHEEAPTMEVEVEIPQPEQVILANDEGIRYAHVQADNFSDAFAQARAQVGAGGVFEYNGQLYGTYTAEEWNNMSAQERAEYQHRVFDTNSAHHHAQATYAHSEVADPVVVDTVEVAPTEDDMIAVEPVDNEIQVLGVDVIQGEDGELMHVALVECEGDQALMIDVDFDGTMDVLIHDDNIDGVIDADEMHNITDANVQVDDLLQMQAAQNGDMFYASNDDMPDYINDADSMMTI